MCTFMLSQHSFSLKKRSKVKSVTTKRFAAYGFPLNVGCTLQISRTNNKRGIGTFMLSHYSLTLKKWSKVKSDTTKRFTAYSFLKVDSILESSRTNNKLHIGTSMLSIWFHKGSLYIANL